MALSIPYDPSLVLGNIVEPATMDNLIAIAEAQAPVEAAQEEMNSLIALKQSLAMTIDELSNLGVPADELIKETEVVKTKITEAAKNYATTTLAQADVIKGLKAKMRSIHSSMESPIDYNKTQIKTVALSSNSLKLDCQYFSFDENKQDSKTTISNIKDYVTDTVSSIFFRGSTTSQASTAVSKQVSKQQENHDIQGTLIIIATCTHKDASVLAPCILDVDKAIRTWNGLFKDKKDKINVNNDAELIKISQEEGTEKELAFNIISGATYGSCFIGMVHILNESSTTSSQDMSSRASAAQTQAKFRTWLASVQGGFGMDSQSSNDIKSLLSTQKIASHANLVTMGLIPSIKSNDVQMTVKQFANFSPNDMGDKLATLANYTSTEKNSMDSAAQSARTGGNMTAFQQATITSVLGGVSTIDDGKNKIIDINSMMTALDDYITKASANEAVGGVPINFFLKRITRSQLAQMWVSKYYPDLGLLAVSGDDSASTAAGTATPAAS